MNTESQRFERAFDQEFKKEFRDGKDDFNATADEEHLVYSAAKEIMAALKVSGATKTPEELATLAWTSARNLARNLRASIQ